MSTNNICFYDEAILMRYKPPHDKTQQNDCAPSEDSDQPGHPPDFAVRSVGS